MEVHHHTHKPKNWKEYITEFLMLFLAVSMGFVAENVREKYTERERSEELMQAFVMDVQENQKQLDSLIINNTRMSYYYDSLVFNHGFSKEKIDIEAVAANIDLWMYRFLNKKTIFEQMKNTGALRYIQDKEILAAMLRYEEKADFLELRSIGTETDEYNNEFRPALAKILPLSFFRYIGDDELKSVTAMDSLIHPGRYEKYAMYSEEIKKEVRNIKLTKEQIQLLAKAWNFRLERLTVGLRYQLELRENGEALLKLIKPKYIH